MNIGRLVRFSIRSLMLLVLCAASASALFAKLQSLWAPIGGDYVVDGPALVVLGIGLNAVFLAAIRKHSIYQYMFQVTVACGLLLGDVRLFEYKSRLVHYALAINIFALLIAPFLLRTLYRRKPRGTALRNRVRMFYRPYALGVINLLILTLESGIQVTIYLIYQ